MLRFLKTAGACVGTLIPLTGTLGVSNVAPAGETAAYYVGYFIGYGVTASLLYGLPLAGIIWAVATLIRGTSSNKVHDAA